MSSSALKLLAASGASKGEATYVDDVFSTFVYDGSGSTQTITNGIKLGNNYAGPSALFTQTSDYLTGTLSGGSNSKTFTFSGWFYKLNDDSNYPFVVRDNSGNSRFSFTLDGGGSNTFGFNAWNSSGTEIFRVTSNATALNVNTWYHIMISVDLANTSNRYLYLNDVAVSANWATYTNDNIEFSHGETFVGTFSATQTTGLQTYISNPYLDYTYRDLSVESNRRLFIASNETPATGQASLNPILYLPFDSASLGSNAGTGGNLSTVGSPYYDANFGPYMGSDGEGGLVWFKCRNVGMLNNLFDTVRGNTQRLDSSGTSEQSAQAAGRYPTLFTSTGFTLGADTGGDINYSGREYVSWTFRKQPGFFDIVTYTGNGANRTIAHNLGSVPGMIIVKSTTRSDGWAVYHRGLNGGTNPEQYRIFLNVTGAESQSSVFWNDTAPTSTVFTVGTEDMVNSGSDEYVAYLFAHDAQDFGTDSDEAIIKCGSFVPANTWGSVINLGFEPQWLMYKNADGGSDWIIVDNMRGIVTGGTDPLLYPNKSDAELTYASNIDVHPNGFEQTFSSGDTEEYIYMAIRRPHKPAEEFAATDLFNTVQGASSTANPGFNLGIAPDMAWQKSINGSDGHYIASRTTGSKYLFTNSTASEATGSSIKWDYMNGWIDYFSGMNAYSAWGFKRAPGFFDVVAYTGTGSAGLNIPHNLGVAPELIIAKQRNGTFAGVVYNKTITASKYLFLFYNLAGDPASSVDTGVWNGTEPTASVFTVGSYNNVNLNGGNYIAYLFASVDGISKVGTYTGTGNDLNVDCGFSAGARFILIKRTDNNGDWYYWDSVRGIIAGNDPYLLLNTTAAQVTNTDYIDPLASGFTVTSSAPAALNNNGGTYIFYAIA